MLIHSKFNYVSELSSTFSDPRSNREVLYSALCCVLSIAFVRNDAPVCCVRWSKRAAVKCLRNLMAVCVFVTLYNELVCRNIVQSLLSLYI